MRIANVAYSLPAHIVRNEDLWGEFPDRDIDRMGMKLGIKQRRVCTSVEDVGDLAYSAAEKVLENYDRSQVDFLILCTQTPTYYLPSTACLLQNKLLLRRDIGAFDVNLGCSGFVYLLALAKGLMHVQAARAILVVVAEAYSKHLSRDQVGERMIFGDAAAAVILEPSERQQVGEFAFGTDGRGAFNLYAPISGGFHMDGPAIFAFTLQEVPRTVEAVLGRNGVTKEEVSYFIFHQANAYMLEALRVKMQIPHGKFYNDIELTGNTVSCTIPIALAECLKEEIIAEGDRVLLCGFGVGYSWAATVVEI